MVAVLFDQLYLVLYFGISCLDVCWILVFTKNRQWARAVTFPSMVFVLKVFLYILPFSHKMTTNLRERTFSLQFSPLVSASIGQYPTEAKGRDGGVP